MGDNTKYVIVHSMSRGGHNWIANVFKSWLGSDYIIHKMEATMPDRFTELVTKNLDLPMYPYWPVYIVTRDYLNWAASYFNLLGLPEGKIADPNQVMKKADIWWAIYREAIDETDYIPNKLSISYDIFVKYESYRRMVCDKIGGTYNEGILNFVPAAGSSFDGNKYTGRGTEMKVLDRWRWFTTEVGEPFQCYLALRPEILDFYVKYLEITQQHEKKKFCESLMTRVK
jgi:hypothetical protein